VKLTKGTKKESSKRKIERAATEKQLNLLAAKIIARNSLLETGFH
jgi:ribonuclease HIII